MKCFVKQKLPWLLVVMLCLMLPLGCGNKPVVTDPSTATPTDNAATLEQLQTISDHGVYFALKQLNKKDAKLADTIADQCSAQITGIVLPYLDNAGGLASSVVEAALNEKFTDKLPDEIRDAIGLAAVALDAYLPAPGPDAILTKDQAAYLRAFFNGVAAGAARYKSNAPSPAVVTAARTNGQQHPGLWFARKKK